MDSLLISSPHQPTLNSVDDSPSHLLNSHSQEPSGISIVTPHDNDSDLQRRLLRANSWTPELIKEARQAIEDVQQHNIVDNTTPTISDEEAIATARRGLEGDTYTFSLPDISSWSSAAHGIISYEPQIKSAIFTTLQEIQAEQHQEVVRLKEAATTAINAYEKLILRASEPANEAIPSPASLAISASKEAMEKAVTAFKNAQSPSHCVELLNKAATELVCYPAIEFFEKRATPQKIATLSTQDKIPLAIGTSANPGLVLDDNNPASLREAAIQTAIELRTAHMLATVAVHLAKEHLPSSSGSAAEADATLEKINNLLNSSVVKEAIFKRAGVSLSSASKDEERIPRIITPTKTPVTASSPLKTSKKYPRTHVRL